MKIDIFGVPKKEERTVYFALQKANRNGDIDLVIVDERGELLPAPYVAILKVRDGKICMERVPHVNTKFVDVDDKLKIKEVGGR